MVPALQELERVIPAKAGTHFATCADFVLGPRIREDDTSVRKAG
jgi:hypothetical protein